MNRQLCWIQDIGIVLGVALSFGTMDKGSRFRSILETRVLLSKILAHRGQICKFLDGQLVASVPTWKLPKHTFMTHKNLVLMHGFHSMAQVGIQQLSLKAYRRWDSTCHRIMVMDRIDEPFNMWD